MILQDRTDRGLPSAPELPIVTGPVDSDVGGDTMQPKEIFGLCRVEVIADSTYFKHDCASNRTVCTAKLVQVIRVADLFYRRQSFDSRLRKGLGFFPLHVQIFENEDDDPMAGSEISNDILETPGDYRGVYEDICLQVWLSNRDWGNTIASSRIGDHCRNYQQHGLCAACKDLLEKDIDVDDALVGLCAYRYAKNRIAISTFHLSGESVDACVATTMHCTVTASMFTP